MEFYQYELKFTLYRAEFNTGSTGTLTLTNGIVPSKILGVDPVRTISGTNTVQITHSNHQYDLILQIIMLLLVVQSLVLSTTLNGAITNGTKFNINLCDSISKIKPSKRLIKMLCKD